MANRDQMRGPMSLEEYSAQIGQDLSQRPVDLTGLEVKPYVRTAYTALPGSSPSTKLRGASVGAEHTGRFLEGAEGFVGATKEIGETAGYVDDAANFNRVTKGLKGAGGALAVAGEAFGGWDDYRRNSLPLKTVVPGTIMRGGAALTAGTLGGLAGTAAAGLIGQMLVPIPGLGYALGAAGGIAAGYYADKHLPSREQFGRGFHRPQGRRFQPVPDMLDR